MIKIRLTRHDRNGPITSDQWIDADRPMLQVLPEDGQTYSIARAACSPGEFAEVSPFASPATLGVRSGSEFHIAVEQKVGAPGSGVENWDRLTHDRIALKKFVQRNEKHLSVLKWRHKSTDIIVSGVRAIVDIDGEGQPIYGTEHKVRILCPDHYPLEAPMLVPLSRVWHPNICLQGREASVCYTVEYDPTGSDTWSFLLYQYVEIIQYRGYNLKEPHRKQNEQASKWLERRRNELRDLIPVTPMVRLR